MPNYFMQLPKADENVLRKLYHGVEDFFAEERKRFAGVLDMEHKLSVHMQSVVECADYLYPEEPIAYVAAYAHDIGRGREYRLTNSFTGSGREDHHVLGAEIFYAIADNLGLVDTPEYKALDVAIKFHGLDKLRDAEGKWIENPKMESLSTPFKNLVYITSETDNIVNGTQAPEYLYREQQQHLKAKSKNGWVADDQQWSKVVTPRCFELFREGASFNRNMECKTYGDYNLFAAFLAVRNLKAGGDKAYLVAKNLEKPIIEICWNEEVLSNGINVKKEIYHKSVLDAYKAVFERSMESKIAKEAYEHLVSCVALAKQKALITPRSEIARKNISVLTK